MDKLTRSYQNDLGGIRGQQPRPFGVDGDFDEERLNDVKRSSSECTRAVVGQLEALFSESPRRPPPPPSNIPTSVARTRFLSTRHGRSSDQPGGVRPIDLLPLES